MKRVILPIVVVVAVAWSGSPACADPFVNPPEANHPRWVTAFPYQRNIMVGFDTDPHAWPDHPSSPQPGLRKALTPDVVHHEGTDDKDLFKSDWLSGNATENGYTAWIDTDPAYPGRQGMLKLGADAGAAAITLVWHIDNWDRPWEEKHFFVEAEYFTTGNTGVDELFSSLPGGAPVTLVAHVEPLADGWNRWWAEATLRPNPAWEEMVNTVRFETSPSESFLLIDHMHIATECVPEPTSFLLLLLGVAVLGLLGRRRRNQRECGARS